MFGRPVDHLLLLLTLHVAWTVSDSGLKGMRVWLPIYIAARSFFKMKSTRWISQFHEESSLGPLFNEFQQHSDGKGNERYRWCDKIVEAWLDEPVGRLGVIPYVYRVEPALNIDEKRTGGIFLFVAGQMSRARPFPRPPPGCYHYRGGWRER